MVLAKNSMEGKAEAFLKRIETIKTSIEFEHEKCKEACAPLLEDIKEIFEEVKEAGLSTKALRRVVRRRDMERKIIALPEALDLSEKAIYESIVDALGPLGQAAIDREQAAADLAAATH